MGLLMDDGIGLPPSFVSKVSTFFAVKIVLVLQFWLYESGFHSFAVPTALLKNGDAGFSAFFSNINRFPLIPPEIGRFKNNGNRAIEKSIDTKNILHRDSACSISGNA